MEKRHLSDDDRSTVQQPQEVVTAEVASHQRKQKSKRQRGHNQKQKDSRALTWALRHAAPDLGLSMSSDGYVALDDIFRVRHSKLNGSNYTEESVRAIVAADEKQRFSLKTDHDTGKLFIRANQGHSIKGILDPEALLTRISRDELRELNQIVHGTYVEPWKSIQRSGGLSKMNRTHIHFASGLPTDGGVISGMRKTCQVYIYVDPIQCAEDDIKFYRSDNGVILSAGIDGVLPLRYISHVTTARGEILHDNRSS